MTRARWWTQLTRDWRKALEQAARVQVPARPAEADLEAVLAVEEIGYECFRERVFYDADHYIESALSIHSLEPLTRLPSLRWLDVSFLGTLDLSPLTSLTSLEHLCTSSVHDLRPLSGLASLRSLDCGSGDPESLAVLPRLAQIVALRVRGSGGVGRHLATMPWLEQLQLDDTWASLEGDRCDSLDFVTRMTRLHTLGVRFTHVSSLAPLESHPALRALDVRGTRVESLAPLGTVPTLRALDCSDCRIRSLAPLEGCRLDSLKCYGNPIPADEVEAFRARHPGCDTTFF